MINNYFNYSSFLTKIGLMSYIWCNSNDNLIINVLIKGENEFNDYLKNLMVKNRFFVFKEEKNSYIEKEINDYLEGKIKKIDLKTQYLTGTDFQKKVWDAAKEINYSTTASYQELAQAVFCPKASRAVGNALGKNPLILIVPCHRIIKKNKEIGWFSSGVQTKKLLLELEKTSGYH